MATLLMEVGNRLCLLSFALIWAGCSNGYRTPIRIPIPIPIPITQTVTCGDTIFGTNLGGSTAYGSKEYINTYACAGSCIS